MKYLIGIQPTGRIHIGNYLGCLAKGLELQEQGHEVTFLIANYHSLTTDNFSDVTEQELKRLGCKKIVRQTPEYTELFFKLCCKLNTGTLKKMPQYNDKHESVEYDLGLLLYPVLMTADIIINDPDVVIIGKDQVAHLELTNDICKRVGVNKRFKYEFGHIDKIMSLVNPDIKMSKSSGEKHVIYLFDEDYGKKLKSANASDKGLENLRKIGDFFQVPLSDSNYTYKMEIAKRMEEHFNFKNHEHTVEI